MRFPAFFRTWVWLAWAGTVCFLASCDKAWEIGQKLKAPEPPPAPPVVEESPVVVPEVVPPPPEPSTPLVDPDIQVSILGYHDFSSSRRSTDMVMHPRKLREQMEALRQNQIPVIPMSDYLAWRRGEKNIPDPCVVITIDDGWEGVYTEAFPIFKEFGYPFSIYLYRNYIGGAGRSLAFEEIEEMMRHGCEVGSHSVSHSDLSKTRPEYEAWLREELLGSLEFLREKFGLDRVLPVFVYPYGKYNARVLELTMLYGYELGLTVSPKKAGAGLPPHEVGRYIIHGDDDTNFRFALSFRGAESAAGSLLLAPGTPAGDGTEGGPLVQAWPEDQSVITSRLPRIELDLSRLPGVIPDSVSMQLSGFGTVPSDFDAATGRLVHQVPEPLRLERCRVTVKFQRRGEPKPETVTWSFQIDRAALYFADPQSPDAPSPVAEEGGYPAVVEPGPTAGLSASGT
jgi:peptidoglycan/xylan/chitin deacetylase (PgdA/CDA1 family)